MQENRSELGHYIAYRGLNDDIDATDPEHNDNEGYIFSNEN